MRAAYGLVEDMAVPRGSYLLQTAAGSVLGRIVIALAKRRGVKTINVVRRSEQKEELCALG
jgi:NADPH:quinone reductase-like Zn-dependent oxidoreductase